MCHALGMKMAIVFALALLLTACGDDGGGEGSVDAAPVDTSGACGIICGGGTEMCVVEGFDPAGGLESCTRACQSQWTLEQDCTSEANDLITCVDANQSCTTLTNETCGDFPASALGLLLACAEG
jgi:hypothetical protein